MTIFKNNNNSAPFKKFRALYKEADSLNQKNIEGIAISSYSKLFKEVDSRYVNLKYLDDDKFIFFSNYQSPKAHQFISHNQISGLIYWDSLNIQIRIKANIKKITQSDSDEHFKNRNKFKHAIAICSQQSEKIDSKNELKNNYEKTLNEKNLYKRPSYWGGYQFTPYYFEFWEGSEIRLNNRVAFELKNNIWNEFFLQP